MTDKQDDNNLFVDDFIIEPEDDGENVIKILFYFLD